MTLKAVRTQHDGKGKEYSDRGARIFDPEEDKTRQEFKDDADLNILLRRFGLETLVRTDGKFTEVDYNMDLQQAFAAIAAAKHVLPNVPPELRGKYKSWQDVLNATESGEYKQDLDRVNTERANAKTAADALAADHEARKSIERTRRAERAMAREAEDAKEPKA